MNSLACDFHIGHMSYDQTRLERELLVSEVLHRDVQMMNYRFIHEISFVREFELFKGCDTKGFSGVEKGGPLEMTS